MDLLVLGKYVLTDPGAQEKGLLTQAGVGIKGSIIQEVGDGKELQERYPATPVLGDGKQLLLPGLIDSHSHGNGLSYVKKGIPYDFLENLLLDKAYGVSIDPVLDAQLCGVMHLRNGCTTIHHNHWGTPLYSEAQQEASQIIQGYQETGIRLSFSPGIRNTNILAYDDRGFYESLPRELQKEVHPLVFFHAEAAVEEYFALFDYLYRHYESEDRKIILGPSWPQGSTGNFLSALKEKSRALPGCPLHFHVLQTPLQKALGPRKFGKSLLSYLDDYGLVDENLVCGHFVFPTQEDIQRLAEVKGSITHHPSCNLAVRNGVAPVVPMVQAGIRVAMGMDNKSINDDEDPIMELRMIYYLHRMATFHLSSPPFTSYQVLEMGTTNGASVCGFAGEIGALKPGMKADLILVNLERILEDPWMSQDGSIMDAFLARGRGDDVETVVVNGEVVIKEGKFLTLDVEELYRKVQEEAQKGLSSEELQWAKKMEQLKPYLHKWYDGWTDFPTDPYYRINSKI